MTSILWAGTKDVTHWRLMLLFMGGALFGIIDHAWNGELLLVSENIAGDLALGFLLAFAILGVWKRMLVSSKTNPALAGDRRHEKKD